MHVISAVTGQRLERRIYIFDYALAICDHHRVGRLLDGARQLSQRFFRTLLLQSQTVKSDGVMDRPHQGRSIQARFRQAVPCARSNDFGDRLLVSVLGQNNERHLPTGMKKIGHQAYCLRISSIMFEEHKAEGTVLHKFPRFFERAGMLEFDGDHTPVALQHIANEKELFLVVPDQEHVQRSDRRFCCCLHMVTIGI